MPYYPLFNAWPTTVKARLLASTYEPSYGDDRYLSDISSHTATGTNVSDLTLSGKASTWSEPFLSNDADDLEWTNATCSDFSWIAIYEDTGSAATSRLIYLLDIRPLDVSRQVSGTNEVTTGTISYQFETDGVGVHAWQ